MTSDERLSSFLASSFQWGASMTAFLKVLYAIQAAAMRKNTVSNV